MTDDRELLLRHVYRCFTSACRCFLPWKRQSPLPFAKPAAVFVSRLPINQSETKWAVCNAPFRRSSRISRSRGKARVNSARTQKLVGGSAPRSTIVIISDHMSDTVRNHLARAFYFALTVLRSANSRTYVIANDACSLMRVYFVNSRTVSSRVREV